MYIEAHASKEGASSRKTRQEYRIPQKEDQASLTGSDEVGRKTKNGFGIRSGIVTRGAADTNARLAGE